MSGNRTEADYYKANIFNEREKAQQHAARQHAECQKDSPLDEEEAKHKQCRREMDARYRAAHRELLRLKACQYRCSKKRYKEVEADEAEYHRLMSLDFDSTSLGFNAPPELGLGVDGVWGGVGGVWS
ncbi:hypothetical protein CPB84DRAFT_1852839 [Gymnopilus junonius]|uniref:Uncharacterized protein n=1 Tax=Gymnopilus junonius TaxID=109634 RepID=A0A9P5NC78_GYMJU|nr:hypothetical protein CPB84DRAFT_1852839 [Gymnopilus junonius]